MNVISTIIYNVISSAAEKSPRFRLRYTLYHSAKRAQLSEHPPRKS